MTEAEWLACDDPVAMLRFVANQTSERKQRLFVCACCRLVSNLLPEEYCHRAIENGEQYSDGRAWGMEVDTLWNTVTTWLDRHDWTGGPRIEASVGFAVQAVAMSLLQPAADRKYISHAVTAARCTSWGEQEQNQAAQRDLLRDHFGNFFRPVTCPPSWRISTAVALAAQMYEARDFGAMPILGDALQDAGCDSAEVLDHCRGSGPHVRGCWVVDLVLGKE